MFQKAVVKPPMNAGTKNLAEILSERDTIAQVMQGQEILENFAFQKQRPF